MFADLGAYLFCLSAKWQIQLSSESLARACFSSLNSHFDNVLQAMCYTQLSESIPENIIHRSYPEGLSILAFRAGYIFSYSVKITFAE